MLRICRIRDIKSIIKYSNTGGTRQADNPQRIVENLLSREFHAEKPNEKWLTDVAEFKWFEGTEKHKVYLSAILDLYDRRIGSFVIDNGPMEGFCGILKGVGNACLFLALFSTHINL